jgi:hypothetical protein
MINWTEADNRTRAHLTTTDRINRQAWIRYADGPGDRFVSIDNSTLSPRIPTALHRVTGLCRAASKVLAVPLHRKAQPS